VDEALVLRVAVLPEPVESGKLAIARIEGRDIIAGVVPLIFWRTKPNARFAMR
jgi:hypothetical protein